MERLWGESRLIATNLSVTNGDSPPIFDRQALGILKSEQLPHILRPRGSTEAGAIALVGARRGRAVWRTGFGLG